MKLFLCIIIDVVGTLLNIYCHVYEKLTSMSLVKDDNVLMVYLAVLCVSLIFLCLP